MRRKDSPEEKKDSGPGAQVTAEKDTASGRPSAEQEPVARSEDELAKGRISDSKATRSNTAEKRSRAAAPTAGAKKKPSRSGQTAPSGDLVGDLPLGSEAMSRIRRSVDRPSPVSNEAEPAPRDRSGAKKEGLQELDWQGVAEASRELARQIARRFSPDLVVGVAKGGVFAGQEIANALGCPFFAVRLHRRSRDHGHRSPEASETLPDDANGKRILIVDDIAGTGTTLQLAVEIAREAGCLEARTATLIVREGGYRPDWFGVETGDLVVFPWDYEPSPGAVGNHDGDPGDYGV